MQQELMALRQELATERQIIEILRSQPFSSELHASEPTIPGLGALAPASGSLERRKRATGAPRRKRWFILAGAVVGLAAGLASLRYPGLMGPLEQLQKALEAWR